MYRQVDDGAPLTQGDIIDGCPLLVWEETAAGAQPRAGEFIGRIVVLTQACDLAQAKTTRVVTALVHDAKRLVAAGILKTKTIQDIDDGSPPCSPRMPHLRPGLAARTLRFAIALAQSCDSSDAIWCKACI